MPDSPWDDMDPTAYVEAHPDDDTIDIQIEDADELLGQEPQRAKARDFSPELLRKVREQRFMSVKSLFSLPPIEWFIQAFLPEAPRTMLHGAGGTFKSFLALDWMLCAAAGRSWHGYDVKPGRVLYVAGEGAQGIPKRVKAWLHYNQLTLEDLSGIWFMAAPIDLHHFNEGHLPVWQSLFDVGKFDYVVFDTLHMAAPGAEENSSTEMGTVLRNATRIVGQDSKLFFVHHTGKSGDSHRGSSALRDDMDVVVKLALGAGGLKTVLTADKIRDAEPFKATTITFDQWQDTASDDNSLYIEDVSVGASGTDSKPKETAVDRCMDAITEMGLDFNQSGERVRDWLKEQEYSFSKTTVGAALRRMRGAENEVAKMNRNRPEDVC